MAVRPITQSEPIPGYRLIERLGRGGFGEVWKAEAPGGLMKAIKFVFGEIKESKDKSSAGDQELRALNRVKTIRHPFILSLERVDIIDSQLIIVMELADRNLADRFKEALGQGLPGIPREELLRYMEEAAEALDLLNGEYQLQHLDIKPQNLFLVRNHIKVGDFGLVKDLAGMKASLTGGVTPVYAAPETFEGWVSRYCDQYSLAIVYQELLTGHRPYTGASAGQLLKQHIEGIPDVSPLPEGDQPIIRRALAKKGEERYPTCMEMVQALRSSGVPRVAPPTMGQIQLPPVTMSGFELPPTVGLPMPTAPPSEQTTNSLAPPRVPPEPITSRRVASTITPPGGPTDTSRVGSQPSAPVEFKGGGVLYPALIIGLGQVGVSVVQHLRAALHERFGTMDAVPNIRLLAMDIDPDTINAAIRGPRDTSLAARETAVIRLNRPTHFVKPRDGQVPIEDWLDPHLLYRIPRNQQTTGLRCLGRLAFVDNHAEIADRVQTELAACTEPDAVATADRQTKLGLRSNRPRVWLVASLAGGTGGGMFIDLAYLARSFLKQLGYAQPDLVGLFFVPPPTQQTGRPLAVGNTYAALAELHHFSQPGTTFTARYAKKEPPLTDPAPPFARCVVLPLEMDDQKNRRRAGLAAGLLYRDLVTPLGRAADGRRMAMSDRGRKSLPSVQTFGSNRLTWPRRALITMIARKLCLRLVEHWIKKDVGGSKAQVAVWAKEQWELRQLAADRLLLALKEASKAALDDRVPEDIFEMIVRELVKRVPAGGNPAPADIEGALSEIEQMIGRPDDGKIPVRTAFLDSLDDAARALLGTCEQKLAEMAVHLVEQPSFRIAGAEEAIRQFTAILQTTLEQQETLANDFMTKSNHGHARIHTLLDAVRAAVAAKKPSPVVRELIELIQIYATLRLRGLIVQHVATILRSLRGNCPEYLRELAYCRTKLLELVKQFEKPITTTSALELGPGRELFPPGCNNLDDTVNRIMSKVTPAQLIEQDTKIQAMLRKHFTAMVHICTTADRILPNVEDAMHREMELYVTEQLSSANAVEMFLGHFEKNIDACEELVVASEKAAPKLAVEAAASPSELSVVVVPDEEAGPRLRELAQKALPAAEVVPGLRGDDIFFYRELPALTLADLPQTGVEAREAYHKMQAGEHFTAHTRSDITDWQLPEPR